MGVPEDHVPAGNLDDLQLVAEHGGVRIELLLSNQSELSRVHEQRGNGQRFRRWWRRAKLAVGGDGRAPALAVAVQAVGSPVEMLPDVFLHEGARRRGVEPEPLFDGVLRLRESTVGSFALREVE